MNGPPCINKVTTTTDYYYFPASLVLTGIPPCRLSLKAEINGSLYQYLVYCRLLKKFIAFFFWIFRSSLYSMCFSDHFSQDHCIVMNMCYCNDPNFGEIKRSPESAELPANTKDSYIAFKYRLGANCSLIVRNSFSTLRSQNPFEVTLYIS